MFDETSQDRGDGSAAGRDRGAVASSAGQPTQAAGPTPRMGDFIILEILGAGASGSVYRAQRVSDGRPVALKVLAAHPGESGHRARFAREIRFNRSMQHPGIVRILDAGILETPVGERPYFSMELIDGEPIDLFVRDAGSTLPERAELLAQVAHAVHHAHQQGVVHRDLKPSNILVSWSTRSDGTRAPRPHVLDFGIAQREDRILDSAVAGTSMSELVGTRLYMSPEQILGRADAIDRRSDVYSLGVLACELFTGRPPYDIAVRPLEMQIATICKAVPRIEVTDRPDLPRDAGAIVATALRKDPADRYQSSADMAADLERFARGEPIAAHPLGVWRSLRQFARRHRVATAVDLSVSASMTLD